MNWSLCLSLRISRSLAPHKRATSLLYNRLGLLSCKQPSNVSQCYHIVYGKQGSGTCKSEKPQWNYVYIAYFNAQILLWFKLIKRTKNIYSVNPSCFFPNKKILHKMSLVIRMSWLKYVSALPKWPSTILQVQLCTLKALSSGLFPKQVEEEKK